MQRKSPFLTNYRLVCLLWIAVAAFCWQVKFKPNRYNNYVIFKQAYYHAKAQTNMYKLYPTEYEDCFYYGPVFSTLVAPFSLLPDGWGFFFWQLVNAVFLLWAIHLLPVSEKIKMFVLLFTSIEFANTMHNIQINTAITACIILSFVFVERGKDVWATLFIVLGTMVKLYPIIGLAFFMFSKNKGKFTWSAIMWAAIFFVLPMFVTSPHFTIQSYTDWFAALSDKNAMNVGFNTSQDISFMGVCRKLVNNPYLPNTPFLLFGALVFGLPLFRFNQYDSLQFRLRILASALLTVVLFSTGSEHPTYVIAVTGAMLWIFLQENYFSRRNIVLLVMLLVITGLGLTDAFPRMIRENIISDYVLKAWPCIIVWVLIAYEMFFDKFTSNGRTEFNLPEPENWPFGGVKADARL